MPHRHQISRKKAKAVFAKKELVAARKRRRAKALRLGKAEAAAKQKSPS